MKFVLKILFAPVIAVLVVLVSVLALILNLSAWVFGIASTILGILGLAVLLLDNVVNGVIILVIAAWMLGQIQRFRYFIQDAVYG